LKKESGKNLAFEGHKSPNFVYRGENCPVNKTQAKRNPNKNKGNYKMKKDYFVDCFDSQID
jgi:hypothetical protein